MYVISYKEDGSPLVGRGKNAQNYPIVVPAPYDADLASEVMDYLDNVYDIDEAAWTIICRRQLPPSYHL